MFETWKKFQLTFLKNNQKKKIILQPARRFNPDGLSSESVPSSRGVLDVQTDAAGRHLQMAPNQPIHHGRKAVSLSFNQEYQNLEF